MGDRPICKDHGDRPGCLGESDPRYDMDFTDVEPGAWIYWCAHCGPDAHAMNDALQKAFATRGPEFVKQLEREIQRAEDEAKNKRAPGPHG